MSYYYSNYITELSVQDLSKNLNERMKENRNLEHYKKIQELPVKLVFEGSNFLSSFEKTLKQLENKITTGEELINLNNNDDDPCNVNYQIMIKNENFDNFPDLTELQIRKYNIFKNEINRTKSKDQMDYARLCLINTKIYLESNENAPFENDNFFLNVLE